jgi:hypothetical protein
LLLPSKNTVLTHRMLALRHGAYAPDVGAATRCLRTGCWRCDTVLTHRVLALRHVTPKWDAAGKPAPLVWLAKVNAL